MRSVSLHETSNVNFIIHLTKRVGIGELVTRRLQKPRNLGCPCLFPLQHYSRKLAFGFLIGLISNTYPAVPKMKFTKAGCMTCTIMSIASSESIPTKTELHDAYMGGCQNYGSFLDPYYNTAPNISVPKIGDHNIDNQPYTFMGSHMKVSRTTTTSS